MPQSHSLLRNDEVNQNKIDCHSELTEKLCQQIFCHPELVSGSLSESHNRVKSHEMLNTVQSLKNVSISLQHDKKHKGLDCHGDFQSPRNDKSIIFLSLRRGAKGEVIKNSKNDVPSSQAPSPQRRRVKNAAFTLAEVLITLSILGVVAAILIPNVVQHYKKNFVETRLRQAYSIIDNVLEMAKIQNGTNFETMFNPVGSNYYQMEFADKFIIPYLNIQKDCGCETCGMPKICKYTKSDNLIKNGYNENYNSSYFYGLNGRIIYTHYGSTRYLQLKNGMYLYILGVGPAGSFIFDINGQKGPNKYGYDIFAFTMFRPMSGAEAGCKISVNHRYCNKGNELLPGPYNSGAYGFYNEKNDPARLDCSANGDGRWCSGLIMYNNWKVPKDYPVKF